MMGKFVETMGFLFQGQSVLDNVCERPINEQRGLLDPFAVDRNTSFSFFLVIVCGDQTNKL